ncbi:MAG: YbhB/YbcL family Raf kinase inhibitor-like protein [Elusimicrobiota bacterium]|nr:YbhB/YbcL family Raf kinase inhibitor-like protein [Elusimicrobiota bacterium]
MELTSKAFSDGEKIPAKYTADGENISPPFEINNAPREAGCYALISDDPDAPGGTWVHWVIWNIPAGVSSLEEGQTPPGIRGKNDFGNLKYGGPAPPSGTHRYYFKLYALDSELDLPEGSTKEELLEVMDGHVIDSAELMGTYSRQ